MCGICGVISLDNRQYLSSVKRMNDALTHRGPDGEGFFADGNVTFGHRRLKIIDLSDAASQPISDSSNSVVVTYNGEIYNYKELQRTLKARGYSFTSSGDSETLPVAYLEWGESFLEHLHGMFAFALYDRRTHRVLLARDRIGIKPLYILRQPRFIAFASEIKAFLVAGLLEPQLNPIAVAEFIQRGYHLGGHSWFQGIEELQAGHFATIDADGTFSVSQFWRLPEPATDVGPNPSKQLRDTLELAASTHLQSDVLVGAHLSGGIDSSTVVALLSKRVHTSLKTFSVYFEEGRWYDERPFIETITQRYHTDHYYTIPSWREARDSLSAIVAALDEPVAGPGVIPQYFLNRDVRAHGVVVVNGGQGGDEMFAGYPRHLFPYALAECASGVRGARNALRALTKLGFRGLSRTLAERAFIPGTLLLNPELRHNVPPFRYNLSFDDLLRQDLTGYLHALLQVEDRTSMVSSVESRVPLLDDAVIELAAAMHRRWKLRDGIPKWVLRDAVADLLPNTILNRKDKRGLPTPFGLWIRGPLRDFAWSVISDPVLVQARILANAAIERMFRFHLKGLADFGALLWRPIALGLWLQNLKSTVASSREVVRRCKREENSALPTAAMRPFAKSAHRANLWDPSP